MKNFWKKVKSIIVSWDFILAVLIFVVLFISLPEYISLKVIEKVSNVYITILSITFSIFFAAFAIILSSSENEFILFLEEGGFFSHI